MSVRAGRSSCPRVRSGEWTARGADSADDCIRLTCCALPVTGRAQHRPTALVWTRCAAWRRKLCRGCASLLIGSCCPGDEVDAVTKTHNILFILWGTFYFMPGCSAPLAKLALPVCTLHPAVAMHGPVPTKVTQFAVCNDILLVKGSFRISCLELVRKEVRQGHEQGPRKRVLRGGRAQKRPCSNPAQNNLSS